MMRKMEERDLPVIVSLEKQLFPSPWKKEDFLYELKENPYAYLLVLEEKGEILGYCDCWILFEQAQIATIGVIKTLQGQGYGQQLLDTMVDYANEKGCEVISLEVRVSNAVAIALYEKNGFVTVNTRKGYYQDNHEDAYLMVKPLGGNEDVRENTGD